MPKGHRFPMEKYELLHFQLKREQIVKEEDFFIPSTVDVNLLLEVHDQLYLDKLLSLKLTEREQKISGFIHDSNLIERELRIIEGTRLAADFAIKHGMAFNIAGGTHHAYSNRGEGFCLLNDQAVAAKWLLSNNLVNNILIIDLDVHQGNGTAEIFSDEPSVYTFSMHGKNNYPLKKETSKLDIALEDGTTDNEYIDQLENGFMTILSSFKPDFIFYQSGVDILGTDKMGRLGLTKEGCKKRDELVYSFAKQQSVPIVTTMGGGYSPQLKDIVNAHCETFKTAQEILVWE